MKNATKQLGKVVAKIALKVATINANRTCMYMAHQPKLPKAVQELRKLKGCSVFRKYLHKIPITAVLCSLLVGCTVAPANLIITSTHVESSANTQNDQTLISILSENLYTNGMVVMNWINAGVGIEKDETNTFTPENSSTTSYVLVTNITSIKLLKANCEMVFSKRLLKSTIYPIILDGETPLFIENKGKLYFNTNTGGGSAYAPDFARAKIVSKSENEFEVEVPITTIDNQNGIPFIYKVIKQDGNWVLDEFYI